MRGMKYQFIRKPLVSGLGFKNLLGARHEVLEANQRGQGVDERRVAHHCVVETEDLVDFCVRLSRCDGGQLHVHLHIASACRGKTEVSGHEQKKGFKLKVETVVSLLRLSLTQLTREWLARNSSRQTVCCLVTVER